MEDKKVEEVWQESLRKISGIDTYHRKVNCYGAEAALGSRALLGKMAKIFKDHKDDLIYIGNYLVWKRLQEGVDVENVKLINDFVVFLANCEHENNLIDNKLLDKKKK